MLLSVVVPCHNEEAVLGQLAEMVFSAVSTADVDVELVLVDDGSRDRTLALMRDLHRQDKRVRYFSLSRNFGKESAMLAGLAYAGGDAVVIMDADLQHPPRLITQMLELFGEGYDQVIARRTREGDALARTLVSRLYYKLANALVEVDLQDGVGDFRLLSRRAVDALLQMGEYNRFSKGLFSWIGFPTATVDYQNEARQGGTGSKWSTRRLLNYGLDGIMSFNSAPLRLAIYVGITVTALSFLYVAFLVVAVLAWGVAVPGYVTIVAAVLGLGGIQLLFLGVIGEYVGRIYFEAKQRPHFIVADSSDVQPAGRLPRRNRAPVRETLIVDNFVSNGVDGLSAVAGDARSPLRSDSGTGHP
jgi:glycosyltransferase involved in cell wall biosynthesis